MLIPTPKRREGFHPWFERLPAFQDHTGFGLPRGLERLGHWRDAIESRPSAHDIANPSQLHLERHRSCKRPAAVAATARP